MAHRQLEPACPERCEGRCDHAWHDHVHDPGPLDGPPPRPLLWALALAPVAAVLLLVAL